MYALRSGLKVLLVSLDLGGQTNYHMTIPSVEEQPAALGIDMVDSFKAELEHQGFAHQIAAVKQVCRHCDGFAIHTEEGTVLLAAAVIIASGVQHQRLNVPGEEEYLMRGLSYSAVSYAHLFSGRTAVIIGDGKLALRSAAEMALVADHVHLVGPVGRVFDSPLGKKLRSAENVTTLEGYQVIEVSGDDYARSVVVKAPDGDISRVSADGFFIEMFLIPNSQMVADLVDLEPWGHIQIDERNRTNVPGIFAAGDVSNTYVERVLVAMGGGAKAALSAYAYLLPSL
jgi:thioredoxin reductase